MMRLGQILQWLPGSTLAGEAALRVERVHSDTRSLRPGDLFVALRGEHFDGNQFLAQARAAGAAAALAHDAAALRAAGLPGVVVADTRHALGVLATRWRERFELPLIAVTGSNGKTTVTQMLASILRQYRPDGWLATEGNLNNDIGLPLTLLRLGAQHRIAVVELGMNHPGEIARLAAMAQPTVALVNNAQREHLEFMATVEAVAQENGAVIDALPASGVAVFPRDDAFAPAWRARAAARRCLPFALGCTDRVPAAAEVCARPPQWQRGGWQIDVQTPAGPLQTCLAVPGLHNVHNALAAIACAIAAGVPLPAITAGLQAFEPVAGRSRSHALDCGARTVTLVDDSYNANPDSVEAALVLLASLPGPRLMVLGDMAEVGDQGAQFHAQAGARANALGIESLFTIGALSSHAAAAFAGACQHDDMAALIAAVRERLPGLGSVLVKGSRFMRMERVVQALLAQAPQVGRLPGVAACC